MSKKHPRRIVKVTDLEFLITEARKALENPHVLSYDKEQTQQYILKLQEHYKRMTGHYYGKKEEPEE